MNSPIIFNTNQLAILDVLYKNFIEFGSYVTQGELTTILEDYATKNYADATAESNSTIAENNANSYTNAQVATLETKFNTANNNTDVGNVYSANLNGVTGTVFFSGVIPPNETKQYTIGNTLVTPNSRITDLFLISLNDINICGYNCIGNAFFVSVRNTGSTNVTGFRITFRVNN